MRGPSVSDPPSGGLSRIARSESARHLLLIAAVSIGYESLFIRHWMNVVDEGLTLYAAMGVHRGGVLYDDVSFVFPPGHLLVAWISYALDPPGVVLSRILYAAFNVALCLALYPLARRIMPARYALFGVLLVAVASPLSHRAHLLFGFRYLVWSALALLAFAERLRSGNPRWLLVSGLLIGVAVCFRLTPAFAAAVGIGAGLLAASRDPRVWLRDGAWFVAGGVAVVVPVVLVFASSVGFETLWREIVVRPVVMTDLQSLPLPELGLPAKLGREAIHDAFVSLLFRVVALVYAVCIAALLWRWLRSLRGREPFPHPLLLGLVVFGAVYYLRSLGRSDEPHLSSAIPPFCIVAAYLLYRGEIAFARFSSPRAGRRTALGACALVFAGWVLLPGAERALLPGFRGDVPFEALGGRVLMRADDWWHVLSPKLRQIRVRTDPDDVVLDLSASPLLYVLLDRMGPGRHDIVMPGTFLSEEEERRFVEQLEASPPALAVLPARTFDEMEERSLARVAPQLMAWVGRSYGVVGKPEDFLLLEHRPRRAFAGPGENGVPAPATPPALTPLDPQRPLDAMLAELARELDANQVTDLFLRLGGLETRVGWFDGGGAFHRPPTTIGISRGLERVVDAVRSPTPPRDALRLLLAHHQAHGMQSRIYTEQSLALPGNRALAEAQADVLAGITLVQNEIIAGRPIRALVRSTPASVAFARRLGTPEGAWEAPSPDDARRLRLLQIGRNVGIFYVRVWTCITNLGEEETREVFEYTVQAIQADLRRNPQLPHFDPRTCAVEDVFDWTLEAAARELARG